MTDRDHRLNDVTRRPVLAGLVGAALLPMLPIQPLAAAASLDQMERTLAELAKGQKIQSGRVHLDMPVLAENGNSVFTTVTVDSPMTATDHVRAIHFISEKNPLPRMASFHFGPRAGRAKIETSIRLAETQRVTALAEMSDGSFWSGEATVIVTLAACIDAG